MNNPENTLDHPPDLIKPNNTMGSRENLESSSELSSSLSPNHIPPKNLSRIKTNEKPIILCFDDDNRELPPYLEGPRIYGGSVLRQMARRGKDQLMRKKTNHGFSPVDKKRILSRFFRLMIEFYLVKKFIRKIRESTFFRNISSLNNKNLKIINDPAFFIEGLSTNEMMKFSKYREVSQFFKRLKSFMAKGLKNHLTRFIHPTNRLLLLWDITVIIITVISLFLVPIRIGEFDVSFDEFPEFIKFLTIFVFLIDILVKFNTAFYQRGQLIVTRPQIFMHYLSGKFFSDLISISFLILTDFLSYSPRVWVIKFFGFLYLLRTQNLSRAISRFEEFCFCDEDSSNLISFLRLLINILLFSHWSACLWKLVGDFDMEHGWLAIYGVGKQNPFNQYIYALYYVVVVTNTVGFGDVVSQTIAERIFTILFIYTACVIFAYTINRVGTILQNINKNENEFKRTMNTINGYLKFKNISFDLKIKVRNYLEYIWQAEKMQNLHETQVIINRLSKSLKEELLLNANGLTLKAIPLFNSNFSGESLRKLACEIREINLTPEDYVYRESQTDDENIYIIRDGEVELLIPTTKKGLSISLKVLKKGEYFGELSFFTGVPRTTSAKSVSFSSLFVLKKETFIEIIKQNNEDYERFCEIRDQILLYKDYNGSCHKCHSCSKKDHTIIECPMLHLTLSKERFLEKHSFSVPQERTRFKRKSKERRINTLKKMRINEKSAKRITVTLRKNSYFMQPTEREPDEFVGASTFEHFSVHDMEEDESSSSKEKLRQTLPNDNKFTSSNLIGESIEIEKKAATTTTEHRMNSVTIKSGENNLSNHNENENEKVPHSPSEDRHCKSMKSMESILYSKQKLPPNNYASYDIDCMKNFEAYYPAQNIENLIDTLNKLAFNKSKRMKAFFPFQDFWSDAQRNKKRFQMGTKNKKALRVRNSSTRKFSLSQKLKKLTRSKSGKRKDGNSCFEQMRNCLSAIFCFPMKK